MDVREIQVRTALVRSRIPGVEYVINPYVGCAHGCRYCYVPRLLRHNRPDAAARWGRFVEAKVNIPALLRAELPRKRRPGCVMLSSSCDPYQPAEMRYRLTRQCIEALREYGWEVDILTRSPLVLRDVDLLRTMLHVSVGLSVPTDDEGVRRVLEPGSPPIGSRIATLRTLCEAGIRTWAFVAPILPMNPARLHEMLDPWVKRVQMDALNYGDRVRAVFAARGWARELTPAYAAATAAELRRLFGGKAEE